MTKPAFKPAKKQAAIMGVLPPRKSKRLPRLMVSTNGD